MKKKIAFLFAVLMLALAGCGSKVNDHVVDYKVDMPEGFAATEQEGVDACWMAPDQSNINLLIVDKDATTNAGFKAITADILRDTVKSSMKEAYGQEPTVTDRYFTKDDVCGLPAYQYSYDMNLAGIEMTQIIVCINADKTYTFTYTTDNAEYLDAFDASAKNIQLTLE